MNKETCGLKKLHKGFWLSLCAAVVALVCCVAVFAGVQAADTSDWNYAPNSTGDGYVVVTSNSNVSGAITIPDTHNGKPVVGIGRDAFLNRTGLTSITIPSSVKSIGWYAFSGCTGLTSITIPDSVETMDWFAFANCTNLTTVTIGGNCEISAGAFSGCTALTDVTIQNGITGIGWSAFKGCTNLENITIPGTVTVVDRYAFYNCGKLANVYYKDIVTKWNQTTIKEGNECLTNATLHAETFGEVKHNLNLEDLITIGYQCTIIPNGTVDEFGILIWTSDLGDNVTIDTPGVQNKTLKPNGPNGYYAASDGIYAQNMNVMHYARPYVRIGENYIYSPVVDQYTPVDYNNAVIPGDDPIKKLLKNTTVSALNYGTYAQIYFAANKGKTVAEADKINNGLTGEEKTLKWDDSLKVLPHDIQKDTVTGSSMNWTWYGTNLSLLDALQMNMAATGDGIIGMYYWTEEDYNKVIKDRSELSKDNKTGELKFKVEPHETVTYYIGTIEDIAAKEIGSVFYVCAYDEQGNLGPIRADSVAAYATRLMSSTTTTSAAKDLAKALLIYGNSAKTYFDYIKENGEG